MRNDGRAPHRPSQSVPLFRRKTTDPPPRIGVHVLKPPLMERSKVRWCDCTRGNGQRAADRTSSGQQEAGGGQRTANEGRRKDRQTDSLQRVLAWDCSIRVAGFLDLSLLSLPPQTCESGSRCWGRRGCPGGTYPDTWKAPVRLMGRMEGATSGPRNQGEHTYRLVTDQARSDRWLAATLRLPSPAPPNPRADRE